MADIPDTIDMQWIGRALAAMASDLAVMRRDGAEGWEAFEAKLDGLTTVVKLLAVEVAQLHRRYDEGH